MKHVSRIACLAAVTGMCLVGTVGFGADQSGNLIANGGFEGGSEGWSWERKARDVDCLQELAFAGLVKRFDAVRVVGKGNRVNLLGS